MLSVMEQPALTGGSWASPWFRRTGTAAHHSDRERTPAFGVRARVMRLEQSAPRRLGFGPKGRSEALRQAPDRGLGPNAITWMSRREVRHDQFKDVWLVQAANHGGDHGQQP